MERPTRADDFVHHDDTMIPEPGHFSLVPAQVIGLFLSILPWTGL